MYVLWDDFIKDGRCIVLTIDQVRVLKSRSNDFDPNDPLFNNYQEGIYKQCIRYIYPNEHGEINIHATTRTDLGNIHLHLNKSHLPLIANINSFQNNESILPIYAHSDYDHSTNTVDVGNIIEYIEDNGYNFDARLLDVTDDSRFVMDWHLFNYPLRNSLDNKLYTFKLVYLDQGSTQHIFNSIMYNYEDHRHDGAIIYNYQGITHQFLANFNPQNDQNDQGRFVIANTGVVIPIYSPSIIFVDRRGTPCFVFASGLFSVVNAMQRYFAMYDTFTTADIDDN